MNMMQCMVVAAFLLAVYLSLRYAFMYWRYLEYNSTLKAWSEIFKIRKCTLEDPENALYVYEFENEESISETVQHMIAKRIDRLGRTGVLRIVKTEASERWIVCFERQKLESALGESLRKAKKLINAYECESSFAQDWLEEEHVKLKPLYEELEKMHAGLKRQNGKLITFFSKV